MFPDRQNLRWMLNHVGSFRTLSFRPVAQAERTADRQGLLDMDAVWARICAGLGRSLNRYAMHFGHLECNITVPLYGFGPGRPLGFALYGVYRLWGMRRFIAATLCNPREWGEFFARPLMVVIHRFMDPGELQTELGRQRQEACVLKLPVDGEMVSLCEVNAINLRRQLNQRGAGRLVANHRQ